MLNKHSILITMRHLFYILFIVSIVFNQDQMELNQFESTAEIHLINFEYREAIQIYEQIKIYLNTSSQSNIKKKNRYI